MIVYLDTSAVMKVLVEETESGQVRDLVVNASARDAVLVSSRLLQVELHRIAFREGLNALDVDRVLAHVNLIDITRSVVEEAGGIPHHVRILDAIHLATAMQLLDSEVTILTYDVQMAEVANRLGLELLQ